MSKFDVKKAIDDLLCPDMFKAGLVNYIEFNNVVINSKKEFDKIVKDYGDLKL